MNKKIYLLILGLLIVSIKSTDTGNSTATNKTDEELCEEKLANKDECLKVQLSSNDKKCCFYIGTNSTDGDEHKECALKLSEQELEDLNKEENFTIKEECHGKFITTTILVLLALLFL